jgi:pimeloyl-ACP methyl ester carboxylesterase
MDPENVKEMGWALQGEAVLASELQRLDATARELAATNPNAVFEPFDLPESDRIVLAREDRAAIFAEVILEQSCNGIWGWADDDLAFAKPWGFDPADIGVTTQVIFGTQDVFVPPSHGGWIASVVPDAIVNVTELGHMGDPEADIVQSLTWLTSTS